MSREAPARAGRREWIGLGVLALPTMVLSMDLSVLHLAAPSLSADLAPSGAQLLWILDVYGFLVAGFLMTMGTLGDRIGRRRLLLFGAAAFAVASAVAACAPTAELLILARALLGIAGSTVMPSTLALLSGMFRDPAQRTFAFAFWMTCFTAGEAIGPLVGGALLQHFWWGSVFLIGVPVMMLLLVTGPLLLPEQREPATGRFDLVGALLSLAAVLSVVYGAKRMAVSGPSLTATAWIAGGLAVGVVFLRQQRRVEEPLMDVGLFRHRAFSAGLATQTLAVAAMAGSQLLVLQYLQAVLGLSPLAAGLWTVPSVLCGIGATLLAPRLVRRVRPALVISAGLGMAAVGAALIASTVTRESLAWTVISFTVLYTGVTPTLALTTEAIVGSAPAERAGLASGISQSGAELGLAGGMAFFGTVAMVVYQDRLSEDMPDRLSASARDEAHETVGGALDVVDRLPDELGTALREAARHAFAGGLQLAAALSAVGLALAASLSVLFLRGMPATQDSPAAEEAHGTEAGAETTVQEAARAQSGEGGG
ncbi:MFS transporter [Streptomyces sp. 71268]|uniref:MFS transporter n=1 Tax=Streptomyces sp. 71268 TaxID=3002640 RepID=UPI0023F97241|nr:MFS transporter [Streptomyces sp. 71268]WEV24239.1 MFS transporter [Streptomyces sp. 71268]